MVYLAPVDTARGQVTTNRTTTSENETASQFAAALKGALRAGTGLDGPPDDGLFGPNGDEISYKDINQGQINDCYFLAALGELAKNDPNFIRNMITDNGDGTYTVTLYQQNNDLGNFFGHTKNASNEESNLFGNSYHPVKVTVSYKDFSPTGVNSAGQSTAIWPQVIEAAYAKLIGNGNVTQGYSIIDKPGGSFVAMGNLTGHQGSELDVVPIGRYGTNPQQGFQQLESEVAQGDLVVLDTQDNNSLPYNLLGDHSYMVIGTYTDSHGNEYVKLQNPWGHDQPSLVPVSAWYAVFYGKHVGTV
jgi:hypothetical protein